MIADLSQTKNLLQNVDDVNFAAVLVGFLELLLPLHEVVIVYLFLFFQELELDDSFMSGRQIENFVSVIVDGIFSASQRAVLEDGLQSHDSE